MLGMGILGRAISGAGINGITGAQSMQTQFNRMSSAGTSMSAANDQNNITNWASQQTTASMAQKAIDGALSEITNNNIARNNAAHQSLDKMNY